jgi:hypothetical protein
MNVFKEGSRHSLRRRLAGVAVAGAAALALAGTAGAGVAGANSNNPFGGSVLTPQEGAPRFNTPQASQIVRTSGSDTTIFMMQRIGDIYTTAGLYGCQLALSNGDIPWFASQSAPYGSIPASVTAGSGGNTDFYCKPGGPVGTSSSGGAGTDISTTDPTDNWDRVEIDTGVSDVGSGAGQKQLCGSENSPNVVNIGRSSKPASNISGCTEQELGYAKDGVPIVDFPSINPATITGGTQGTPHPSTFGPSSLSTSGTNGNAANPGPGTTPTSTPDPSFGSYSTINGGNIGPVSGGWLPGDNPWTYNVNAANNGTSLQDIDNTGTANTSVAYRMWCAPTSEGNRITDWGQLTNLGPNLEVNVDLTGSSTVNLDPSSGGTFNSAIKAGTAVSNPYNASVLSGSTTVLSNNGSSLTLSSAPLIASGEYTLIFATTPVPGINPNLPGSQTLAEGNGVPVGIPLRILGVNTASGTDATFSQFANGANPSTGQSTTCVPGTGTMDQNAANDPNTATAGTGNAQHLALENNVHQLELFSTGDFPSDAVDQAVEEATSLYFISQGVYNTNNYVGATAINGTSYSANLIAENGLDGGTGVELNNSYPTARTLSNVINASTVTAASGGFVNWICDSNTNFTKGTDLSNGLNYDQELTTIISTNFGFPRLSDLNTPVTPNTPQDNVIAPNDDCTLQMNVTVNSGSQTTLHAVSEAISSGTLPLTTFPTSIQTFGSYSSQNQSFGAGTIISTQSGFPGTAVQVTSAGGSGTLTVSQNIPVGTYTVEFLGVPSVGTVSSHP